LLLSVTPTAAAAAAAVELLTFGDMAVSIQLLALDGIAVCIVSRRSPLILGHDLTDDAVMDRIWPIITNRDALKISQSFGASKHPGGLVRKWTPPSHPSAPPNETLQWPWALNDDPVATRGWSLPADVGKPGHVRHRAAAPAAEGEEEDTERYDGAELCLTAPVEGKDKSKVLLSQCTSPVAPNQSWVREANGTLHLETAHDAQCLVLANGRGPSVELFRCKPGGNEEWNFSPLNGTLCSHTIKGDVPKCISARNSPCDGDSGDGTMQLWAKPQPGGAVAVFILNNLPIGSSNISSVVTLAELNYTAAHAAAGGSEVLDVWSGEALPPLEAGATELHAAAIGSYSSTFLLITPRGMRGAAV
jgi:hypothetical protein